jgi:hypothetical protein
LKRKTILKEAVVLTIGILLVCTSVAGIATTNVDSMGSLKCETPNTPQDILPCTQQDDIILWDNYVLDWIGGYHSQDDTRLINPIDSNVADDFMFEEETEVSWIYWQIWYGWKAPKDYHYDYNITFFEDDGTGNSPGAIYEGPITIHDADIDKSLPYVNESTNWICGATAQFPEPITFDADTKYWITIYGVGPITPYTYFSMHNESMGGILLHEAKIKSEYWGYPVWTNFSEVPEANETLDANFVLCGGPLFEITISKGLGVTITIINNLPEGDDGLVHNMTVNITTTGGFVLNPIKNVLIPEFEGQTTETIKYYPIGLGSIAVDVYCTALDIGIGDAEASGTLLLFFLL